ncbi:MULTISPECIES: DUF3515 domain-containing protein [unclassified Gordonia (in: high G+C Gram-positive bacteria)]|uniref:DUF3515 domain-containing protein n=1 Tax=unclassified Gordonia (in: high G+C Gram-positive bacteria) TaxID=2657482 RepID=UPI001F0EC81E|nr:DUF3515 domain-containing protein [Gordonia sp. ABSL49_1]MCH5643053.1 DUF3515 domain-containing protein [Gordonia sp. ABSL49_1]
MNAAGPDDSGSVDPDIADTDATGKSGGGDAADDRATVEATTDEEPTDGRSSEGRPAERYGSGPRLSPALIATLVTIPIMVLVGFITYAALNQDDDPTPVDNYTVDTAVAPACEKFLAALPEHFDGFGAKEVRGQNATWPASGDGDDLTLRCGVTRPADLAPSSKLQVVDAPGSEPVQWFIVDTIEGQGQSYVAVDHRPYVALWVPANAGNGPITDITGVIAKTLPPGPLEFAPAPSR